MGGKRNHSRPGTFRVGDRVRFTRVFDEVEGVIAEDRGPLGPGGEQIYRVEVEEQDLDEPLVFELPVSLLKPAG